jgi:uncharacterized protein YndB with AHSA1/START domain
MEQQINLNSKPLGKELVITRAFNAPRDVVFKMWTEAKHLEKWWGPKGVDIIVKKFDLQPEGIFLYCMAGEGFEMWGRFVYLEIVEPEKLVFISSFSDNDGNITRAPFSATWPLEVMNTLTLTEDEGKTTLTLRGGPHNATEEEREFFGGMFESMNQGFAGTFEQLDEYLANIYAENE